MGWKFRGSWATSAWSVELKLTRSGRVPGRELRAEPLAVDPARHGELFHAHVRMQLHVFAGNEIERLAHA